MSGIEPPAAVLQSLSVRPGYFPKWNGRFYRFTHMIFGLSTAPAIWQYAMDRICDYLRSLGLNVIVYLDVFLLIADSAEACSAQLNVLQSELTSLGLSVNH